MKKLVYEHKQGIENELSYASQVEMNLNKAVELFNSFQSFAKVESEKEAFAFAENPTEYFDRCMIAATNVKPIGNVPLNPESIATMYGINRQGFISSCVGKQPGGSNIYPIKMTPRDRKLVNFENGRFKINEATLSERLELHRVYAESEAQNELLNYWENLANVLNAHIDKGFVNHFELFRTARVLGLHEDGKKFVVNYSELALAIKKIA